MKCLKTIIKSVTILLVLLQANVTNAKALDNTNLNDLATRIANSNEGKEYIANTAIHGLVIYSSNLLLSDSELLTRKEKLEKFKTMTFENLSLDSKNEFAKLAGYKTFEKYKKMSNILSNSYEKLINTFPTINVLNKSEKVSLFESVAGKMDLEEAFKANCPGKAFIVLAGCLGLNGAARVAIFVGCMATSIAGEEVITEGAATAAAETLLTFDARVCTFLAGAKKEVSVAKCVTTAVIALFACF
jgi:hypothetical protein